MVHGWSPLFCGFDRVACGPSWQPRSKDDQPLHPISLEALGGRCTAALDPSKLLLLADAFSFSGDLPRAAACYALAGNRGGPDASRRAWRSLALVASRAPRSVRSTYRQALRRAAQAGVTAAEWPLARLSHETGASDAVVLAHVRRFLAGGESDPMLRAEAVALRGALLAEHEARRLRKRRSLWAASGAALLLLVLLVARRYRGLTLARALKRCPSFYPDLADVIGRVRHDVIKHRASALSALRDVAGGPSPRENVAEALLQPEPASRQVVQLPQ